MQRRSVRLVPFFLAALVLFASCGAKEIPFTISNGGRIVLEANVNGTTGKFFWDTGSWVSQVNCRTDNLKWVRTDTVMQLGDSPNIKTFAINGVSIGGVRVAAKSEITGVPEVLTREILAPEGLDGMLGLEIFNGYWCEVSFSRMKIILHKTRPVSFAKSQRAWLENGYVYTSVDVDGTPVNFVVDTGTPNGMRFPDSVVRAANRANCLKVLSPGLQDIHLVKTGKITAFGDTFEGKNILTDSPFAQVSLSGGIGVIGVSFLYHYDLLFDLTNLDRLKTSGLWYSARNISFAQNYGMLDALPSTGVLGWYRANGGLVVGYILADSPLGRAGVTPKSVIAKINGKSVSDITDAELSGLFYTSRAPASFTLLEDGVEKTVTAVMDSPR
jgi:hypothetical protein